MMSKKNLMTALIAGMTVSTFMIGCGDEDTSAGNTDGGTSNTSTSNTATSNTSTSNTSTSNTATSNTATSNTATSNTSTSNTATSNTSTSNTSTSNTTPPADPCMNVTCDAEQVCNNGVCIDTYADPASYPYDSPGSFINSIELETDGTIGDDVDGDGMSDNALGNLLSQLSSFLGDTDINGELANAIASGDLALGMTWPSFTGLDDISSVDSVELHFMRLSDPDADPATTDTFEASLDSFIPGSGDPQIIFAGGTTANGALAAGPAQFALSLNLGGIPLDLLVDSARLVGDVSLDANGVALANGDLSGAVPLESLVGALNGYLRSDSCACLGLTEDLISGSGATFTCGSAPSGSTCASDDICGQIAGLCAVAVPIISGQADIDLSGDGTSDSISVFIHVTAVGTNVSGPAAE